MVNRRSGRVTETRGAVWIPLITLALVLAVAVGAYRLGQLNRFICDGPCGAEYVTPPDTLGVTDGEFAVSPSSADAGPVDAAKVEAAVRSSLSRSVLGSHVGFIALDPVTGNVLAKAGSGTFAPASTTKVMTVFAALRSMDPGTRFATRVVSSTPGSIVLIGGGDPFLNTEKPKPARYGHAANLTDLAAKTATALKKSGTTSVSLGFDDSLFSGPDVTSHWESSYVPGNIVTPVSALWTDQGVGANGIRERAPAASAAATFATLLENKGISVKPSAARVEAVDGATEIARVDSAPLRQLLEYLMQYSANDAAEVILRQVAIAEGKPGTFADGAEAVKTLLGAGGIDTTGLELYDGSGLSRDNLVSPLTLAETIRVAALDARTASLVSDLPIGGFNGSILGRFGGVAAKAGLGIVHAKSGTLTGIHSLAGFVSDAEGRPMVFAVMADRTAAASPVAVKGGLDDVAAALAACSCGL
ncbi:MAG: D-alanyl-D-alanine carboxypeptidase/D-alanyl-D-alanine-endopeptidase [Kineosporiaceae bacterium]|nr:D-alanyl-D-alanine carboxypeptidase/D-alanyl-D-alanine-endopeptidase [Aeromicrobium sp.]